MTAGQLPRGFGRRNPHCSNCGDERGGDFGHELSECQYRPGMTAEELAKTMSPKTASGYWSVMIDRYFERELGGGLQAGAEPPSDTEATGRCCCAECVGMGLCDRSQP